MSALISSNWENYISPTDCTSLTDRYTYKALEYKLSSHMAIHITAAYF